MDTELETLIRERYAALPADLKKAIAALPVQEIMQDIATKNGLHIDKTGDLYTETMLVMLGVDKIGEFEKNLQRNLGLDPVTAKNVEIAVNERIFLAVRETLRQLQEIQEAPAPEEAAPVQPAPEESRDNILAEIENPTPAAPPITVDTGGPAKPAEIVDTKESVAAGFIGGKLTETVNIPSQKVVIEQKKVESVPEKPKSYPVDPYREPLM